jgi:hypothetical protein
MGDAVVTYIPESKNPISFARIQNQNDEKQPQASVTSAYSLGRRFFGSRNNYCISSRMPWVVLHQQNLYIMILVEMQLFFIYLEFLVL